MVLQLELSSAGHFFCSLSCGRSYLGTPLGLDSPRWPLSHVWWSALAATAAASQEDKPRAHAFVWLVLMVVSADVSLAKTIAKTRVNGYWEIGLVGTIVHSTTYLTLIL